MTDTVVAIRTRNDRLDEAREAIKNLAAGLEMRAPITGPTEVSRSQAPKATTDLVLRLKGDVSAVVNERVTALHLSFESVEVSSSES